MDVTQLEKVRPCGRLETYSTARHHLGFYNNVSLTATYSRASDVDTPIPNLVFAALHHLIASHPNLSTIPVNEEKSYPDVYFARLPEIEVRKCVEFHTRNTPVPQDDELDTELDELLSQQHSRNFRSNVPGPYWRLVITVFPGDRQVFTASWIFHHALSDGASSMLFHEAFLEGINAFSRAPQRDFEELVSTPSTPLAPPLEDMHPMTISWSFFLRAIAGSVMPGFFKPRPQELWTGAPVTQEVVPSNIITVVLSAERTKELADLCRRKETSVTAALSTLLAAAIFETVDPPHDEIRLDTPISLRPFLSLPNKDKTMLNAITNLTSTFYRTSVQPVTVDRSPSSIAEGFDWTTARRIKSCLSAEVAKQGADNPIALLKYVSNMHDYFTEKIAAQRETTAEVSNLGVYRPQASSIPLPLGEPASAGASAGKEPWTVGRMVFSQSTNHTGPLISLSAVTGGDGCLVLNFNLPQDPMKNPDGSGQNLSLVPRLVKQGILDLVRDAHNAK